MMEYNIVELSMLGASLLLLCIQLSYYLGLYSRLPYKVRKSTKTEQELPESELPPISVVVAVKGDGLTLMKNLPTLLEQTYPTFEVIVIYDQADEDCSDTLKLLQGKYPHLYYSFVPETARYVSRKKLAITTGIKASKYEWLVFTEADCQPCSKEWLRTLATYFTPTTDIVLGYSNYEKKAGWFNKEIRFDTLINSLRFLGMALNKLPYMGKGRNLAYRKSLFFKKKGFAAHLRLERGEDDLFINQHATKQNTRVATHPDSFICISHPSYRRNWRIEKSNYAVTSSFFKGSKRFWVGFETTTRLLFLSITVAALAHTIYFEQWLLCSLFAGSYFIRHLVQALVLAQAAKQLNTSTFYFSLPILEVVLPLQNLKYKLKRILNSKNLYLQK
ncbi:MAG: glycosyltransferase [Phocaeicola sp.]